MRDRSDTRTRIQEVALDLFTEHGYEATSLREIAERLGVTKAALYYHFKTKEDIVTSLIEDRLAMIEELLDWAHTQPDTVEMRREFVQRYAEHLHQGGHDKVMRFLERNQTALRDNPKSEQMRDLMLHVLEVLGPAGTSVTFRLKSALAVFALHASTFLLRDGISDEERHAAGLQVALDLIDQGAAERHTRV
ncbi:MAG: TetR/AcrR family transcriptional regulator [Micromonosporaceae bacterium]|nr:TetR/AcrR family transcriptional regulator [Micromonosporaceae bacterium]